MQRNRSLNWRRRGAKWSVGVVALAALAIGPGTASADTPCSTRATSQPFVAMGDSNRYFVAPNGRFEDSADGVSATEWSHTGGSRLDSGFQNPWYINAASDAQAAWIPRGGTLTSAWFCANSDEDSIRFFVSPQTASSRLELTMTVSNGVDQTSTTTVLDPWSFGDATVADNGSSWFYSPRLMLPDLRDVDGRQWVQLKFRTISSMRRSYAGIFVDDIMVDPWRSN